MKKFSTTVVERRKRFQESMTTHPMETAWASEAIFFIHAEEIEGEKAELEAAVQISPDGVNWIDEGTSFNCISQIGTSFVKVSHFGGFLRLRGKITGEEAAFRLTIHLVLKE